MAYGHSFKMDYTKYLIVLSLYFAVVFGQREQGGRMEIMAFDYHRVFNHYLNVGECVSTVKESNTRGVVNIHKCSLQKMGERSFHKLQEIKRGTKVLSSASDLFDIGGLCDGVTVTSIGLLKQGDCALVQMAKQIPFSNKTYTIASYAKIRLGIEVIRTPRGSRDDDIERFVSDVTHGAFEIVSVTMFFDTTKNRDVIKSIGVDDSGIALQFGKLRRASSGLQRVTVATFSTARNVYQTRDFYLPTLNSASDYIYREESYIDDLKVEVMANDDSTVYHLTYGIGGGVLRADELWCNVTTLEIQLVTSQKRAKEEHSHHCNRGRHKKKCLRLEMNIKRVADKTQKQLHRGRQQWYLMTPKSRKNFITKMKARVENMVYKLNKTVVRVQDAKVESVRTSEVREKRRKGSETRNKGSKSGKKRRKGKGRKRKKGRGRKRNKSGRDRRRKNVTKTVTPVKPKEMVTVTLEKV